MKATQLLSKAGTVCLYGLLLPFVHGHSWGEDARRVDGNGTVVGEAGYARGSIPRSSPEFADTKVMYILPPSGQSNITSQHLMNDKPANAYTDKTPRLQAAPGGRVVFHYQENGHVSLPDKPPNKPKNRGTVFIYGTTTPNNTAAFLDIHHQWTPDGKGGNGQGRLLATRNYDDGQCHQNNNEAIATSRKIQFPQKNDSLQGNDLWCQANFNLPADLKPGSRYTIYWVWDWPTLDPTQIDMEKTKNGVFPTQGDGVVMPEVYTSVYDIDIVEMSQLKDGGITGSSQLNRDAIEKSNREDISNSVILEQLENQFLVDPEEIRKANRVNSTRTQPEPTITKTADDVLLSTGTPSNPESKTKFITKTKTIVIGRPWNITATPLPFRVYTRPTPLATDATSVTTVTVTATPTTLIRYVTVRPNE